MDVAVARCPGLGLQRMTVLGAGVGLSPLRLLI